MTDNPSPSAAVIEAAPPSRMGHADYREMVRSLCVTPGKQCDLFEVSEPNAGPWVQHLLLDALSHIDEVETDLQVQCIHSTNLGKCLDRCLSRIDELEAELGVRQEEWDGTQESHFREYEIARDSLLRLALVAATAERERSDGTLNIEASYAGEWGCEIRITRPNLRNRGYGLITLEPSREDTLSVDCRYERDEEGVYRTVGSNLLQRILSSVDLPTERKSYV